MERIMAWYRFDGGTLWHFFGWATSHGEAADRIAQHLAKQNKRADAILSEEVRKAPVP